MKKKKKKKNICPYCKKKMRVDFYECPCCGGVEVYTCPKCYREFCLEDEEEI